ncbi:hypothetical protein V865_008480 [Kwoniella europaea PYCC6329]|uniref:Protein CPL1-like domain-containing protein n=1 Tax=Kwoniella europaea PYCC6329 TaxID=1423913 RepID=A0AAX4KXL1_9TREE
MFVEIAGLLGLLSYVWADVYIGCFTPQASEDMNLQWQIIQTSQSCRAICAAQSLQYTFEHDTIGAIGVTRHCACAEFAPSYNYLVGDQCSPDDGNTFVWKADPIWSFDRCYPGPGHQGGTDTRPFSEVDFCFLKCSNTSYATMFFDGPAREGFYFAHVTTIQINGVAKLPPTVLSEICEHQRKDFCPAGLTACNLPELGQEGYECVDTDMDPESCGGCIHGEYGVDADTGLGKDCTEIPGATISALTCQAGKCVLLGCAEGHVLVDQSCSPSMS